MTFYIEQSGQHPIKLSFYSTEEFIRQLCAMILDAKLRGREDFRIEVF